MAYFTGSPAYPIPPYSSDADCVLRTCRRAARGLVLTVRQGLPRMAGASGRARPDSVAAIFGRAVLDGMRRVVLMPASVIWRLAAACNREPPLG